MLDEVLLACAKPCGIGQELTYHVKLVVSRENLNPLLFAGLFVLFLYDLGVVLQYVGESTRREDASPKVVSLDAIGVRGIPRALVITLVERQKPRVLGHALRALQFSAHEIGRASCRERV